MAPSINLNHPRDINTTYGSTINADGQLNISAHNINNGGTMWGEITNVKFSGDNLTVTGNLWGYTNLAIVSAKDSNVSSGNIHNTGRISGIDISLITNGDIIQDGNLVSGNSMTVKSVQFKNNNYVYGKSVQIESNNVHNKATIDSVDANIIAYYGMKNEAKSSQPKISPWIRKILPISPTTALFRQERI